MLPSAADRWRDALHSWAVPDEILAQAPESPWGFPVGVFVEYAREAIASPWTPTHEALAQALPDGGSVLDVGAGAGAASIPVAPPAGLIVVVDQDEAMLDAAASLLAGRARIEKVAGLWPEVDSQVPLVDVVVCANVAYNVAEIEPFITALDGKARHRVVLEVTDKHPQTLVAPLWRHFWDLDRPTDPTADDLEQVVREVAGHEPRTARWMRRVSYLSGTGPEAVGRVRRRLCLPESRDAEIAQLLDSLPDRGTATTVTMWWDHDQGP